MLSIRPTLCLFACLYLAQGTAVSAQELANPSFEQGEAGNPSGWILEHCNGHWSSQTAANGDRSVVIEGSADDEGYWRTPDINFQPFGLYAVSFQARRVSGTGGTPITGPSFCNVDYSGLGDEWEAFTNIFRAPTTLVSGNHYLRFGQWHVDGAIAFDNVQLVPVQAVHRRTGEIVLGAGERIEGNSYTFDAPFNQLRSNDSRPLAALNNIFYNTLRFAFRTGSEVVYRHTIGGKQQNSAALKVTTSLHNTGAMLVQASTDGTQWTPLGRVTKSGGHTLEIPGHLLPADQVWVRLASDDGDEGADFQLNGYRFTADLSGPPMRAYGATDFVEVTSAHDDLRVVIEDFGEKSDRQPTLSLRVENTGLGDITVPVHVTVRHDGQRYQTGRRIRFTPGVHNVQLGYERPGSGAHDIEITIGGSDGFVGHAKLHVPIIHETGYGARLPDSSEDVGLWWAASGWKVSRTRPLPTAQSRTATVQLAKNEVEAVQFVVRPRTVLRDLRVDWDDFKGPGGALLPKSAIEVLRVKYVTLQQATDRIGEAGEWPDPLPPVTGPLKLEADRNQPFWVRVSTPHSISAGRYAGELKLAAKDYSARVPIEIEVFDFLLPDVPTCESALSLSTHRIFEYHGLKTEEEKRAVLDLYLQNFSDHRINPYNPAPLDPFVVTWPEHVDGLDPANLKASIDWSAWDEAMERAFSKYHFKTFELPIAGMGGGTFHSRREPELLGFKEDTPEYRSLFESYTRQVEAHLKEKGWLDSAFVYWFDEPDPKDYAFVMNGFEKLKSAAPGIRRMLTEQPEPALFGGPNLWCPILDAYDHGEAQARRTEGERFWWYVCTEPKAPYTGLFIDHPGTEMRVWLWQTWKYGIDGILVWTTNYWSSTAAYPDSLQNPYEDPMSWTSGYGLDAGAMSPWGNGDGRLIYPPLEADAAPEKPVIAGPVDSLRWEMLRDGIEDYEYLSILQRLLDDAATPEETRRKYEYLLQVPQDISESITAFTSDPAAILERREALARAIERVAARHKN